MNKNTDNIINPENIIDNNSFDEITNKIKKSYEGKIFTKIQNTWPEMPSDALDKFIEERIDLIIEELKENLEGINIEIIDTKEKQQIENE